jgi:hypothetical protein
VSADPELADSILNIKTKHAIVLTDSCGPQLSNAFEVKRRMAGVGLEELEILIGQRTSIFWKRLIR